MAIFRTPREPLPLLAEVGFAALLAEVGGATEPDVIDDEDEEATAESAARARAADMIRVRDHLLSHKPHPRGPERQGVKWLGRQITWPDRVPDLVPWAGQVTLAKVIPKWAKLIAKATDLMSHEVMAEGPTGLDLRCSLDAIDAGFSTAGMKLVMRPGLELLAIVGLETLPLISRPRRSAHIRECGFVLAGVPYRMPVEHRSGYYYRWGMVTPADPFEVTEWPKESDES